MTILIAVDPDICAGYHMQFTSLFTRLGHRHGIHWTDTNRRYKKVYTIRQLPSQSTFNAVYNVGQVDVHQNNLLQPADYTASTGTTVVLGTAAALNDEITITCHNTFSVADAPSLSQGGTFKAALERQFDTTQNTMKTAIFQTNEQTMSTDTTIASTENASCNGPLTIALILRLQ